MTNTVDPLGGSYFVEALTNRMEQETYRIFREIGALGGVIPAIEHGYFQREIADSAVNPQGEEPFTIGGSKRKAMHYVLKVEIGGVAGVVAPIVRKQPPDIHVWILGGEAPAFVKSEGPLYLGGPIWRIELVSPVWP